MYVHYIFVYTDPTMASQIRACKSSAITANPRLPGATRLLSKVTLQTGLLLKSQKSLRCSERDVDTALYPFCLFLAFSFFWFYLITFFLSCPVRTLHNCLRLMVCIRRGAGRLIWTKRSPHLPNECCRTRIFSLARSLS